MVCGHEWSFLEGGKKHNHTLKAGRHFFPFSLELGGSLPSSLYSSVYGGASIAYKLRAHVVRPGLGHNLQAVAPVTLLRTFSTEALEYQQTLEIENTWPDKLMYSLMVPHKAWAAGDDIVSLVKFSPMTKGVRVMSVNTSVIETTKILTPRHGHQARARAVASSIHEIVDGKAVPKSKHAKPPAGSPVTAPSTPAMSHASRTASSSSYFPTEMSSTTNLPSLTPASPQSDEELPGDVSSDVVAQLSLHVPSTVTATHGYDPIVISHRIEWVIFLANPDGHISELRCCLPLHILDHHCLDEARVLTSSIRRLLVSDGDEEGSQEGEEELPELPSYHSHLRDRVANLLLSESLSPSVLRSEENSRPVSQRQSRSQSRYQSRAASRHASRAPSPERTAPAEMPGLTTANETYVHSGSDASRHVGGLFAASLIPFNSLTHPSWLPRSSSHHHLPLSDEADHHHNGSHHIQSPLARSTESDLISGLEAELTAVPDYEHAVLGYCCGLPPLSSMTGLPSYNDLVPAGTSSSVRRTAHA